jgi:hypothetical protein
MDSDEVLAQLGGRTCATINAIVAIAAGVGPALFSHVYDVSGSYASVLWASVPVYMIGAGPPEPWGFPRRRGRRDQTLRPVSADAPVIEDAGLPGRREKRWRQAELQV